MLEYLDARRFAAGARRHAAQLALPVLAAAILTLLVMPQTHGGPRVLAGLAALAIVVHAAIGLTSARATRAAMAGAVQAIESASRATSAVLGLLRNEVLPAVEASASAAAAMTSDRRLSAPVRGRAAAIRASSEAALTRLCDIVRPVPVVTASVVSVEDRASSPEPVTMVEAEVVREAEPVAAEPMPALDGLRVLVGEANGVHQLALRTQLAQFGIEAQVVGDGVEVLEIWRNESWDLILLDVQMPRMDGLEAARTIRALETRFGWAATPILGLAPSASSRQAADCAEAGMSGCLAKPVDGAALLEAMEAALAAPARAAAELPVRMARAA